MKCVPMGGHPYGPCLSTGLVHVFVQSTVEGLKYQVIQALQLSNIIARGLAKSEIEEAYYFQPHCLN